VFQIQLEDQCAQCTDIKPGYSLIFSLFYRAVADQLYGDEDMHRCVRAQCMDYIVSTFSLKGNSQETIFSLIGTP